MTENRGVDCLDVTRRLYRYGLYIINAFLDFPRILEILFLRPLHDDDERNLKFLRPWCDKTAM